MSNVAQFLKPEPTQIARELRESAAVQDIAVALNQARRFVVGLPPQSWHDIPTEERIGLLEAATKALRGITQEQRLLAEYLAAIKTCEDNQIDWFILTGSQQYEMLMGARTAINAADRFLKGQAHPQAITKAKRAQAEMRARIAQHGDGAVS